MTSDGVKGFECSFCVSSKHFSTDDQFAHHLRLEHCSKEGGSYVCRYGPNKVCRTLPLEGVCDKDYEDHVQKFHLSNASSDSPSLVKDSRQNWSVFKCTQNLAAVLNDPRKSRREVAVFFTRHWGEGFVEKTDIAPCARLPKVTSAHFAEYLSKISKRRKHQMRQTDLYRSHKQASSDPGSSLTAKTSVGDVVPAMFFSSKFSLEDPQCFEALFLTENLDIVPPEHRTNRESRLKPNKIMQEKLSYYLDAVEIQISKHIQAQSGSFFKAMTSHDELNERLSKTSEAVRKLRASINNLDEKMCVRSLRVLRLQAMRSNHDALIRKVELIATVKQTQAMVQTLLNSGDFLGALELIATTQMVLRNELVGVMCLRHLSAQLSELENFIGKMLNEEFTKCVKLEFGRASTAADGGVDEASFVTSALGILRVRDYRFVDLFEEEVASSIKNLIRELIRERTCADDSASEIDGSGGFSLADQMRKMDFATWTRMFDDLLNDLLGLLKKTKYFVEKLIELLDLSFGKSSDENFVENYSLTFDFVDLPLNETDYSTVSNNLNEFVFRTTTYCQERCVRVVLARAKDGFLERLSVDEFLNVQNVIERFSTQCDELSCRRIHTLRNCVQAQALKLAQKFHEDRKTKLGNILDLEHWKVADVPLMFQEIVDEFEKTGKLRDVFLISERNSKPSKRFLTVNGENYVVVGTGLIVLQMISQYCQFVEKMPWLASELISRLVELLKNFNSRTCQLILGAGALQLVGLKTIGARNLALASRCLQMIGYFVPFVGRHFETCLPANQLHLIRHVTQTAKDYQDHVDEIFVKLMSIVEALIQNCLMKWEVKPPAPSPSFQQMVKQMRRFHENIADVLPANQIQKLFLRIHDKFKCSLRAQLKHLKITPHDGALYSFVCSEFSFYMENLKSLPSCAAIDDSLQDVLVER